jgi:PAS domain S-box-containing protein
VKNKKVEKGDLRSRAEALIAGRSPGVAADTGTYEEMLHELVVYQTELEMQNEELRKAQEVIEESRTRCVDLYDFAPVAYLTFDENGRIVEANLTACGLLGVDRRNLIGKLFSRFVAPGDQDAFYGHRREVLKKGTKQTCELLLHRPDGAKFYVSMESMEANNGQGPAIRSALIDISERRRAERERDMTANRLREAAAELKQSYDKLTEEAKEREKAEARLRQAQKMEALGTMAGGIAHDFNNILAAIIGFTEIVTGHTPQGSKDAHYLNRVIEAGTRGRELVRQMLAFSRHAEQERKPLRLSGIVNESVKFLRASIPTTIAISINIMKKTSFVLADPVQVQQVLLNLCANAAHAMREKGGFLDIELSNVSVGPSEVQLCGVEPGPFVKLLVRDTGAGMPADIKERIFDPFFTTKGVGEGTGLGLSVVLGIVRQSGGYITVESTPGKGSAFAVHFPEVATESAADTVVGEEALLTGSERILLVDDEEILVEMGEEILTDLGYNVTCRTSSREALALFRLDPSAFDLIVSDQTMPELTGLGLAREVMVVRPDMPVIMCTGFSDLVDADVAKTAGIKAFAMKPLTKRELAGTIRKVLDE